MKIVRVTYTTTAEHAGRNAENIGEVMKELKQHPHDGINYFVCLLPDGRTFVHMAFFASPEDEKTLTGLPVFRRFQERLMASRPEVPPRQESLTLVGASGDFLPL